MLLDTNTNVRLKRSSWCVIGSSFRDKGAGCGEEQAGDTLLAVPVCNLSHACHASKAQVTKLQMKIQCKPRVINCVIYTSVPGLFWPLIIFSS